MKKFVKLCCALVCVCVVVCALSLTVFAANTVVMYSANGKMISVDRSEVNSYKRVGWYENIEDVQTTLYSKNRSITVFNSEVDNYLAVGWHRTQDELKTTIYSKNGTARVYEDEVSSYLAVGWSLTPVTTESEVTFKYWGEYNYLESTLGYFYVDYATYYSYDNTIYMEYVADLYGDTEMSLKINCFNAVGELVDSKTFDPDAGGIELNGDTCWFIIKPYGDNVSGEYVYYETEKLYAPDGREMTCFDLQASRHTEVGWMETVPLYALDGRRIEVSPLEADAYIKLGWYTSEGYDYHYMVEWYNEAYSAGDWDEAMNAVDVYMDNLWNTEYEWPAQQMKNKAMDKWRASVKKPLVMNSYYISGDDNEEKEAHIEFRNISYKPIIAFRLKFTCHNVFGEEIYINTDFYYVDDTYLPSGSTETYIWDLNSYAKIKSIKNVKIYDVIFEDGSKA